MIKIYKSTEIAREDIVSREMTAAGVEDVVADIIYDVRKNGDEALCRYAAKFDKIEMTAADLIVPEGGHNKVALDMILQRIRAHLTAEQL